MIDYIRDVVKSEVKKAEILKHVPGIVVSIVDNTYNGKAVVNIMGRKLTLPNKTGEILKQNDSVVVHYWDNVANGYIALRYGLPNPAGGLNIQTAVAIKQSNSKVSEISKYVGDIYSDNKYKCIYDTMPNVFYINGCPAFLTQYSSVTPKGTINYDNNNTFATGIKGELSSIGNFSQQITVSTGRVDWTSPISETFYTHISQSTNKQGRWAHYVGLYSASDDNFKWECDNVYFYGIPLGAGIIIVCNSINPLKTKYYPHGYALGFLAVSCAGGYVYRNSVEVATNLIYADTTEWRFAFASDDERDYAINLVEKNYVIPSTYSD